MRYKWLFFIAVFLLIAQLILSNKSTIALLAEYFIAGNQPIIYDNATANKPAQAPTQQNSPRLTNNRSATEKQTDTSLNGDYSNAKSVVYILTFVISLLVAFNRLWLDRVEKSLESRFKEKIDDYDEKLREKQNENSEKIKAGFEECEKNLTLQQQKSGEALHSEITAIRDREKDLFNSHSAYTLSQVAYCNFLNYRRSISSKEFLSAVPPKSIDIFGFNAYLKLEMAVNLGKFAIEMYDKVISEDNMMEKQATAYANYAYFCAELAQWEELDPSQAEQHLEKAKTAVEKCWPLLELAKQKELFLIHQQEESCYFAEFFFNASTIQNSRSYFTTFKEKVNRLLTDETVLLKDGAWAENARTSWERRFSLIKFEEAEEV